MGKAKMRNCLGGCRKKFFSSCPAERYCPSCRKKIRNRMGYGMEIFSVTAAMERHMRAVEEFGTKPYTDPVEEELAGHVTDFLTDPTKGDFDDSKIYDEIADEEKLEKLVEVISGVVDEDAEPPDDLEPSFPDEPEIKPRRKRGPKPKQQQEQTPTQTKVVPEVRKPISKPKALPKIKHKRYDAFGGF